MGNDAVTAHEGGCPYTKDDLSAAFSFLSADETAALCPYVEMRQWSTDAVVMQDGDSGDFFGFLVRGRMAVKLETSFPGRFALVAMLESGSMIGEAAVVEKTRRSATVIALEPCSIFVISRIAMDRLLVEKPDLGVKILKRIIHVLSQRLKTASIRLSKIL